MICRIATFSQKPQVDPERVLAFRAWMKEQPGFHAGYHVEDPKTGKHLSISIWKSLELAMAMKDRTPPGGAMGLKPDAVEIFALAEEF